MSLSIHNILRVRARATQIEGGNWVELIFDTQDSAESLELTLYLWRVPGSDEYCVALANAINSVPLGPQPKRVELEDEVPF